MKKLRKSDYFLIFGFIVLVVGAVLSLMQYEQVANYVLIAGAVIILVRGLIRTRERDDNGQQPTNNDAE